MRGACIILFILRSSCIGDLWVQWVQVCRLARSRLCMRPNSHKLDRIGHFDPREERKLICPFSNDSAHPDDRRDEISEPACPCGVRLLVVVGRSRTSPSLQHALLTHSIISRSCWLIPTRLGEITCTYTDTGGKPQSSWLTPFWAICCCSPDTSHANLLLGSLDNCYFYCNSVLRFGAFRPA